HHGKKMPECDQIWFAFLGPDIKAEGEVKRDEQLYQNQIAKTLASLLGLKYVNDPAPGEVISTAAN
ncbi:MAG TPA: phosphoglyceromutase, partial [Cyclobacteriaceae bacterium]|nr:phosphoglyceromutase [Cyclobacteriaceae bacterium]